MRRFGLDIQHGKRWFTAKIRPQNGLPWQDASVFLRRLISSRSRLLEHDNSARATNSGIKHTESSGRTYERRRSKLINRDFFLSILSSTATKREAKSYLSRFKPAKILSQSSRFSDRPQAEKTDPQERLGANLGNLYLPARAIERSPVFSHTPDQIRANQNEIDLLHVALVVIRAPESLNDGTLQGIGRTLCQLSQLGLVCVVVVDYKYEQPKNRDDTSLFAWRDAAIEQADRVAMGIENDRSQSIRRLDGIVELTPAADRASNMIEVHGEARISNRELLLAPLWKSSIPVIASIAYNTDNQKIVPLDANEIALALTRELTSIVRVSKNERHCVEIAERARFLQNQVSLDRIIVLDPHGSIPSLRQSNRSHVFVNLEQEFKSIATELLGFGKIKLDSESLRKSLESQNLSSALVFRKSISEILEDGLIAPIPGGLHSRWLTRALAIPSDNQAHLNNLQFLRSALAMLPRSSSALLTTPGEAAHSSNSIASRSPSLGVGTRVQRNPLIHNLLTDKPIFSSSLPPGRRGPMSPNNSASSSAPMPTTLFKHGMPVTIIPSPNTRPWLPPKASTTSAIQLLNSQIDFARLIHLIEDSFGRKLDAEHYLHRVRDRIAGVIIAGEYQGGAVFTWETPPGLRKTENTLSFSRQVPYLDKFAVLKRLQGIGGVADILFKAMVDECFPSGVCWRSRRDNPVNKWYFERARGTWNIPDSEWTMFWTTEGIVLNDQNFLDYEGVCRAVTPSWADKNKPVD